MIYIKVEKTDLIDENTFTLAQGRAWFDGRVLKYAETAPDLGLDTVELRQGEILLMHKGDTESIIVLKEEGTGSAELNTPFGSLSFTTKLLEFEQSTDNMTIAYELLVDGEVISRFRLKYDITERAGGPGFGRKPC